MLLQFAEIAQTYHLDYVILGTILTVCVTTLAVQGELFRNW